MIILAVLFFGISITLALILFAGYRVYQEQAAEIQRLWVYVRTLDEDKRLLTESLCRSEGKMVNLRPTQLVESKGWLDGKPQVKVTAQ